MNLYDLVRPVLWRLDAECAHDLTLGLLKRFPQFVPAYTHHEPLVLSGLTFPNRLGLAAGLDKNGLAVSAWQRMGFGHVELGTVTPRPQAGNPKPRLFRLSEHEALINRMGFNNAGVDALVSRLEALPERRSIIGINLGKNKDTPNEEALQDYRYGLERAAAVADYVTINVSSPNTAGLRDLQEQQALEALLRALIQTRDGFNKKPPIWVKIAPDNDRAALMDMAAAIQASGVDGVIATNTTIDKSGVAGHVYAQEAGGLSGKPLFQQSLKVCETLREALPDLPLIAVGGVFSRQDMLDKLSAGADLVQVFSGMVYRGPQLLRDCLEAR